MIASVTATAVGTNHRHTGSSAPMKILITLVALLMACSSLPVPPSEVATDVEHVGDVGGAPPLPTWTQAIESIRNPTECPLYRGLILTPQEGMQPWRRNQVSGLWEFLIEGSGDVPGTNMYGAILPSATNGIVMVLFPSCTTAPIVGVSSNCPPKPFFLATHELSVRQAQWLGASPQVGSRSSDVLPLANVSWAAATRRLAARSMRLPTEEEWVYACTLFEDEAWWATHSKEDRALYLIPMANVAAFSDSGQHPMIEFGREEDEIGRVAMCGSLAPLMSGLFDTYGNIAEWVDSPSSYQAWDTERAQPLRVLKGGSYNNAMVDCLPSASTTMWESSRVDYVGFRAARSVL